MRNSVLAEAAHPTRGHGVRGGSLLMTAAFISIMSVAVGVAYLGTANVGRLAARTKTLQSAIAVGDAYLESAFAQWRTTCRAQGSANLSASSLNPLTPVDSQYLTEPRNFSISNYRIAVLDHDGLEVTAAPVAAQGEDGNDNTYLYRATVDVTAPTRGGSVTAKVRRMFEKRVESPWKYAIFYNEVLELHPSPTFTVTGPVHTNGKLFAAPDGGNPLTFRDRVTYADSYFQGYAPGNWAWRGRSSANGAAPTYAAGLPPAADVRKDFAGITPTQFGIDSNKNRESYRELIERPDPDYTDPLTNANGENPRLYNVAQARVLVDKDNNVQILNSQNQPVTDKSKVPADKALYDAVSPAIFTGETFKDQRENATVRVVSLDLSRLNLSAAPSLNTIYISDTSAGQDGKTNKRGVRLRNGATLPGNLTVVSDNPVYVQGNYNSSGTRRSAAVIGDAIMVMSQNWKDANSDEKKGSGKRTATNTTINAAFLGGIVPTDSKYTNNTAYSGGVENFPRFMENWSNVTFTYNGSMVQLFSSKQAIGRWGNNSEAYDAPIRTWAFDTLFRTNPPPGSLFTTTYVKQRWYMD